MKQAGVKVVVYQPYYNADASKELANAGRRHRRGGRHRGRAACRAPTMSSPSSTSWSRRSADALSGK